VSSYTITVAPNDDSGNSSTVVVDTSDGQVRITDVHLHNGGGLSGGAVPTVDFGLLLRAIAVPETAPQLQAAPAGWAGVVVEDQRPAAEPAPARTRRRPSKAVPEPSTPAPLRRGRPGRTPSAQKATAASASARKSTKSTKATAATSGERAYRRMPADFAAVHEQIGSPSAIAVHYDVPRYTVQNWIRRIRAATTTPPAE